MNFQPQVKIPNLAANEVHVWLVRVSEEGEDHLSDSEISRALRYRKKIDRLRYRIGRSAVRKIISGYLSLEPSKIHIMLDQHGKPMLSKIFHSPVIDFNLSHSNELILIAFARARRVGIDIEHIRSFPDLARLVSRYFTEKESLTIRSIPGPEQTSAFFSGWTRKEALLKAIGRGLQIPLNTFEVTLDPDEEKPHLSLPPALNRGAHWELISFSPAEEYIAALAVEGRGWNTKSYRLA